MGTYLEQGANNLKKFSCASCGGLIYNKCVVWSMGGGEIKRKEEERERNVK